MLVLLAVETMVVFTSFLLGILLAFPDESYITLNYQYGYLKILIATVLVLLCSHWFDLYDFTRFDAKLDMYFRLFLVPGLLALGLAVMGFFFPRVLPGNNAVLIGLVFLTFGLFGWRTAYSWLVQQAFMQEKVYVLGSGERAQRLVQGLRQRKELGIDVIGWSGNVDGALTRETAAAHLMETATAYSVHRVIVAMPDRRGTFPMHELLQLRLNGVRVEESASWLEKMSGRIEVEQLYPSWLIFADGFRFSSSFNLIRRMLSTLVAMVLLIVVLPILPFVILAIKLDSEGPILYRQRRVGRAGHIFNCYKFRTMRQDAEADTGPTWADDDDPRITRIGKFLRTSRLDEIPQLWCVFKGDMAFVGPRPERPEFVEWLSREIPYYGVRHAVRPGITGWAQVRYKYGNTIEDAKEKLQYDLFYIKNASPGLDLLIMFHTIKIVLLGRGAQ